MYEHCLPQLNREKRWLLCAFLELYAFCSSLTSLDLQTTKMFEAVQKTTEYLRRSEYLSF